MGNAQYTPWCPWCFHAASQAEEPDASYRQVEPCLLGAGALGWSCGGCGVVLPVQTWADAMEAFAVLHGYNEDEYGPDRVKVFHGHVDLTRVLFLDFEAVLNPEKWVSGVFEIDPRAVMRLNRVPASLVFLDAWGGMKFPDDLQQELSRHGFYGTVRGITHGDVYARRDQVWSWLHAHREVTRYAVCVPERIGEDIETVRFEQTLGLSDWGVSKICRLLAQVSREAA